MTSFDPDKITFFAKTDARGQEVTFGIKAKDRQRHMYVVGKTGMGKSTLLENMAAQDIKDGHMRAIGFLVGQVMKQSKGRANPAMVQKIIREKLGVDT